MIIQHPTMQELHPSITNPFLTAQQKNPFSIILTVSLVLDHSTSTLMTISVKHVTKALPSIKYRSSVKSQSSKKKYLEALSIPMLQIIMENLLNSVHHPTETKEPRAVQVIQEVQAIQITQVIQVILAVKEILLMEHRVETATKIMETLIKDLNQEATPKHQLSLKTKNIKLVPKKTPTTTVNSV